MEIVVKARIDGYYACLKGYPEVCGCGKSLDEAIGNLIRTHPKIFKIPITTNL